MDRKKILELDKICRVCICERKDMRPLFSEKVAEMLMECASVIVEPTEGWPDKICVQCVHSVSRCHAFKMLVERSDKELREYIKSLTVRVLVEETPENKTQPGVLFSDLQHLKLQHQQQDITIQEQTQVEHMSQQKLQNQEKLEEESLHEQPMPKQQQLKPTPKKKSSFRKSQIQVKKLQQQEPQHSQAHQVQQSPPQPTPQPQHLPTSIQPQQHIIHQNTLSLAEPITLHATQRLAAPPSILSTGPQLLPINTNHSGTSSATLMPTPTAALPQQILLPNGQILTTTQIVTTNGGTPQLTQIITNPNPHPSTQPQYTPQFIQTTNGQTLQLIQQSNGQQVLQFVQIVPQRIATSVAGSTPCTAIIDDENITMVDEDTLIEQTEQHLIDDDEYEEVPVEVNETLTNQTVGGHEQVCETIVVEDDQLQVHQQDQQLLNQREVTEMEYLEDITDNNSGHNGQGHHLVLQESQHMLPSSMSGVEDEDDIIEEIHLDEEVLEDDDPNSVLLDESTEFLCETDDNNQLIEQNLHVDCQHIDSENATLTQYTVVTEEDGNEVLVETEVNAVLHAACLDNSNQLHAKRHNSSSESLNHNNNNNNNNNNNVVITTRKSKRNNSHAKALANSRQLAATASSIAASGGDEDVEIDKQLIIEFINQQTAVLKSGRYMCNLCHQEFRQLKGLQNHMHSHSNWIRANCKKLPQCEICQKSFKGPGMLKMHMKTHQSAMKIPTCQICNKTFKTKAILYRHRQTHQQRCFLCAVDNCRKGFSSPLSLKAHIDRKHPERIDEGKFKCGECMQIFFTISDLNDHIQNTNHGGIGLVSHQLNTSSSSPTTIECQQIDICNITGALSGNDGTVLNITSANNLINNNNNNNNNNNINTIAGTRQATTVTLAEVVNSNGEVFIVTPA